MFYCKLRFARFAFWKYFSSIVFCFVLFASPGPVWNIQFFRYIKLSSLRKAAVILFSNPKIQTNPNTMNFENLHPGYRPRCIESRLLGNSLVIVLCAFITNERQQEINTTLSGRNHYSSTSGGSIKKTLMLRFRAFSMVSFDPSSMMWKTHHPAGHVTGY